jgi:hypothetical protein
MSKESQSTGLDFDRHINFHNHSVNLPHLRSWVDELVSLTENSLPVRAIPTTDQLIGGIQRYDAIFRELIRQTALFSEPLTKLYGKVWSGTLELLDYMIKSYHRYVTQTNHLKDEAQRMMKQRQKQVAATNIQIEESNLERTVLRAKIRTQEAELDAVHASRRSLERENTRLREILDTYIKSGDAGTQPWSLLDTMEDRSREAEDDEASVFTSSTHQSTTKSIRSAPSAGQENLRNLNRLDIEMNEAIANVLKEEDRQRLMVADLHLLVQKNRFYMEEVAKMMGKERAAKAPALRISVETQVDEADKYGSVNDLYGSPKRKKEQRQPPDQTMGTIVIPNLLIPFLARKDMISSPDVLRVPPLAWLLRNIYVLYEDKIREDTKCAKQNKLPLPMGSHMYNYFLRTTGLQATADAQLAQFCLALRTNIYKHKRVMLFCHQVGVMGPGIAGTPALDVSDTAFILSVIQALIKKGELRPEAAPKGVTTSIVFRSDVRRKVAIEIVPEILGKWLSDGGIDCVQKLRTVPGTDKGSKYVDVDTIIELFLDIWFTIRIEWEDHLSYVFSEHCSTFSVVREAAFADDKGNHDSDTVLVNVQKALADDCNRRPLRKIQDGVPAPNPGGSAEPEDPAAPGLQIKRSSARVGSQQGNPNKEPVVDLLTRQDFIKVCAF